MRVNNKMSEKEVWFKRVLQFENIDSMFSWLKMMEKDYFEIIYVDWINKTVTYKFPVYVRDETEINQVKNNLESFYKSKIEVVKDE